MVKPVKPQTNLPFAPPNPHAWLSFHVNHYLSTPEGADAISQITQGMPKLKDAIQKNHVDKHSSIIGSLQNPADNVSLNNEEPLVPAGQSVRIPTNTTPSNNGPINS